MCCRILGSLVDSFNLAVIKVFFIFTLFALQKLLSQLLIQIKLRLGLLIALLDSKTFFLGVVDCQCFFFYQTAAMPVKHNLGAFEYTFLITDVATADLDFFLTLLQKCDLQILLENGDLARDLLL